ncbi:MAG: NAD-dependent epimerase/dehydratase family protein [Nitrospinae bacterium]|nr:NAD-dependent epimerase/dehydratase family protein [Nitrospinota bacterium]
MTIAIITGSCGLVGSECVRHFARQGMTVVGVDNDMRRYFFGDESSTGWMRTRLEAELGDAYRHYSIDIRDTAAIDRLFADYEGEIGLVVHTAAQPSHDWAAREALTDFTVNANGTLNLLEATRHRAPEAVFIFTSTNKVYGDTPNYLPLVEGESRWNVDPSHPYAARGIDEMMSIDQSKHSLFGASKVAADIMTQEYGRYFGMKTGVFRGGCLTGPAHSGAELHGFLSYLTKCVLTGKAYTIFGYKGKQVRDNIHSDDLARAFEAFYENPRPGEVYNMGGGVASNCSVLEAFAIAEKITGKKARFTLSDQNRIGDHIWYISDLGKFRSHYPAWDIRIGIERIIEEIVAETERRLAVGEGA